jgi:SAM-dependent methyltransferase
MNFWRLKILVKLSLSILPVNYRTWSGIGIFKHGKMDDVKYAWNVFNIHFSRLSLEKNKSWRGMELGPGDGIMSSIFATLFYKGRVDLVDTDSYINNDLVVYKKQLNLLKKSYPEINLSCLDTSKDVKMLLQSIDSKYFTKGLESLELIDGLSYDLIFSQAVLEHVKQELFIDTMKECYRLLKPKGIMSHVIDFKDHMGGELNNMRFPSDLWESEWFASAGGFYTNRIKITEIVSICEEIGFSVEVFSIRKFPNIPIKREQLSKEFKNLSNYDLSVSGSHLIMKKL